MLGHCVELQRRSQVFHRELMKAFHPRSLMRDCRDYVNRQQRRIQCLISHSSALLAMSYFIVVEQRLLSRLPVCLSTGFFPGFKICCTATYKRKVHKKVNLYVECLFIKCIQYFDWSLLLMKAWADLWGHLNAWFLKSSWITSVSGLNALVWIQCYCCQERV